MQESHTTLCFRHEVVEAIVFVNVTYFGYWAFEHKRCVLEAATANGDEFFLTGRHTVVDDGGNAGRVFNTSDGCLKSLAVEVKE